MIEDNKTKLLFDTGANANILLHNMNKLGINPQDIDVVMISHDHWDHVGGLDTLLSIKPNLTVYKPTFSTKPQKILTNFMTTGTLGEWGIREQALIGITNRGLILITGCSHPGLENVIDIARNYGNVYAVVGGFHGFNRFEMLKDIKIIVPCHCTRGKQEIARLYPGTYSKCGAGKIIEF